MNILPSELLFIGSEACINYKLSSNPFAEEINFFMSSSIPMEFFKDSGFMSFNAVLF